MRSSRLWLFPLLLAVLVAGGWYFGARSKTGDRELPVYVEGGRRMAEGAEIYRRGADPKPFTYPPFAAVPFVPYARLPASWQAPLWFAVNFLLLLPILCWLHRWAGRDWLGAGPPRRAWLWLLVGLLAARHVFSVFENQSHDLLVFAPVALAIAIAWRPQRWSQVGVGAAAGLAAAIKATPLLFVEWLLLRRSWHAVGGLLATMALLSVVPDWLWPRTDGRWWVVSWYEETLRGLSVGGTASGDGTWNSHSFLNQSLSGTLTRLFSPPTADNKFVLPDLAIARLSASALGGLVHLGQVGVVAAIAWGAVRAQRLGALADDRLAVARHVGLGVGATVVCGMVLLSPQSSKAHFCVLLLPAVFCVDRLLRARRDPVLLALLALALLLGTCTGKGWIGTRAGNVALGLGAVTWSTVLLLAATLRALRPAEPAAAA